jgi:hypothetical protein
VDTSKALTTAVKTPVKKTAVKKQSYSPQQGPVGKAASAATGTVNKGVSGVTGGVDKVSSVTTGAVEGLVGGVTGVAGRGAEKLPSGIFLLYFCYRLGRGELIRS